jgi:polysaccharide biosynthesis protein PslH
MHVLYLVPHVPAPTKSRSFANVNGLQQAGHRVTVATLKRSEADAKHIVALRAQGLKVLEAPLARSAMIVNALQGLIAGEPLQYRLLYSPALQTALDAFLTEDPPDIIHVEHLRMARYARNWTTRFPVVWDAVDHLATLFQQTQQRSVSRVWRLVSRLEAPRLQTFEIKLTEAFPRTLVISSRDEAGFLRAGANPKRLTMIPMGRMIPPPSTLPRHESTLILSGNLNYHPNVAAVLYFMEQIWPLIQREFPAVKLQLVGAQPAPAIQVLASESVEVTGFVPEILPYLQQATVALAPITYAAGVQTKVLEACAAELPLVATTMAIENLGLRPDEHVLTGDTPQAFAAAVSRLLRDASLREQLGQAGRAYVVEHYALDRVAARLIACYNEVRAAFRKS